jgi:hypothetical protein
MKLLRFNYSTSNTVHNLTFDPDQMVTAIISSDEVQLKLWLAAFEMAFYKWSQNPLGQQIRRSAVNLDCTQIQAYEIESSGLKYDQGRFREYILGENAIDFILYLRDESYRSIYDAILERIFDGNVTGFALDQDFGMAVIGKNNCRRSAFLYSAGELQMMNLVGRLTDLKLDRFPFLVFQPGSMGLLDRDRIDRFTTEFLRSLQQGSQVIWVCRKEDLVNPPLSKVQHLSIIDLDSTNERSN